MDFSSIAVSAQQLQSGQPKKEKDKKEKKHKKHKKHHKKEKKQHSKGGYFQQSLFWTLACTLSQDVPLLWFSTFLVSSYFLMDRRFARDQ